MARFITLALIVIGLPLLLGLADEFTDHFNVPKENFASVGRNAYFSLMPGDQLILEGKGDRLEITVTDQTKMVDGVETRIVEERETEDGELVEVSRNFFAIDKTTNDVYYFGEEVDIYKDGKIVNHEGAWESGKDGARFGRFMPAQPRVGEKFYQEVAPKVAMDRAEIVSLTDSVEVPAGRFENVLKVEETTPLEPGVKEYKLYAPNVGLLVDGGLKLVKRD